MTALLMGFQVAMTATEPPLNDREKSGMSDGKAAGDGKSGPGSRMGSGKSATSHRSGGGSLKAGSVPSPNMVDKDNPAADLRNMRRIIAEDPDWSLATVPMLVELCISHIIQNFESKKNDSYLQRNS